MDGGKSNAMDSIAEMKKQFEERKKAMKQKQAADKVGESNDILVVDDDDFQLKVLNSILTQCGYNNDEANSGARGVAKYKTRVASFVEGMQRLEYVTTGFASSKYMSVDMLFENLIKNVVPPARFIIADYNMPEMMGSEMCVHIRSHFEALTA